MKRIFLPFFALSEILKNTGICQTESKKTGFFRIFALKYRIFAVEFSTNQFLKIPVYLRILPGFFLVILVFPKSLHLSDPLPISILCAVGEAAVLITIS